MYIDHGFCSTDLQARMLARAASLLPGALLAPELAKLQGRLAHLAAGKPGFGKGKCMLHTSCKGRDMPAYVQGVGETLQCNAS